MSVAGLIGLIAFALGVAGSIALHEVGHLVPAKRFGVRVTQYMVGFGPTVWSKLKGETEYVVKAIPLRRMGQPDEVANVALFLASDEASYITGQVLFVCGGRSLGGALV